MSFVEMDSSVTKLESSLHLKMLSSILPLAALVASASAIVEPLNTTILGPYGFVPPVYPSRMFL
jgi:hypothetical protein